MTDTDEFLEHYGVKGMRWGQRKKNAGGVKLSSEGKRSLKIEEKVKKGGVKTLTNKELADFNKRIGMENQLKTLTAPPKKEQKDGILKSGNKFAREILAVGATVNAAIAFSKSPAGKKMAENFAKSAASRAASNAAKNTAKNAGRAFVTKGALTVGTKALGA